MNKERVTQDLVWNLQRKDSGLVNQALHTGLRHGKFERAETTAKKLGLATRGTIHFNKLNP